MDTREALKYLESRGKIRHVEEEELVRAERNQLLRESDWAVVRDTPLSEADLELVMSYRQALRDLPEQEGFPEVGMPEKPKCL